MVCKSKSKKPTNIIIIIISIIIVDDIVFAFGCESHQRLVEESRIQMSASFYVCVFVCVAVEEETETKRICTHKQTNKHTNGTSYFK